MTRILVIAWKDVRQAYRNVAALALMFAAPLVLTTALVAAFGSGENFSISAVRTVVVNQDTTLPGSASPGAGSLIVAALKAPQLADVLTVTTASSPDVARQAVEKGEAAAAVIIPAGLTSALGSQGPPGKSIVTIYKDPTLTVGPGIVSAVVQSVADTLNGARAAAMVSVELASHLGLTDEQQLALLASHSAQTYSQAAQSSPPVEVEARGPRVADAGAARPQPNIGSQVLLGMMLFMMLFGASIPARSLLDEERLGILPRLFATPTSRVAILGGKFAAVFLVVLGQAIILLIAGRLLFSAHWGPLGPVALLTVLSAFVAASLALVTVSFAKTPGQAGAVSSAIFVFMALLGGNFVGSLRFGGIYALARRFTPNGWLLEGWGNLLYGGSWSEIALPAAAALLFSLVFFTLAILFLRRRYA